MLQKTTFFREVLLVNQHIVVHLLSTHFAYPESIIASCPLVVERKAILDHISGQNRQRVSTDNKPTFLIHNLLSCLVLTTNQHLNILQLVFGKPLFIFKDSHNLRTDLRLSSHCLLGIHNLLLNNRRCLIDSQGSSVVVKDILGSALLPLNPIAVSDLVALLFDDL